MLHFHICAALTGMVDSLGMIPTSANGISCSFALRGLEPLYQSLEELGPARPQLQQQQQLLQQQSGTFGSSGSE